LRERETYEIAGVAKAMHNVEIKVDGLSVTTVDQKRNQPKACGLILLLLVLLGLTAGLCTVFALVVTAANAWVERAQAHWPEVPARVQRCGVDIYSHKRESYWINCSISYVVRGEEISSHVHSHSTPAPRRVIGQDPAQRFDEMREWAEEHPEGTPIVVHYDPANHKKAVLVTTDMPMAGPQTPNNLKLLGFFAVASVLLIVAARIARPWAQDCSAKTATSTFE
jgi:hypothetical protein